MIKFREPTKADYNFLASSWLKSFRKFEPKISADVYYKHHNKLIDLIMQRAKVIIACNEHDEEQVFGYIVYEECPISIVHYVYVKEAYRKMGIAKALGKAGHITDVFVFTHLTHASYTVFKDKKSYYNPYRRYQL